MARILYAVAGHGLGHATRAHSVGDGLLKRGHEVRFVSSLGGERYLAEHFPGLVERIFGLEICYHQGEAQHVKTILHNCRAALRQLAPVVLAVRRIFDRFKPDLLLTDFEAFTANMAMATGVPFVSLDNQHLLTHCAIEHPRGHTWDFISTYMTIRYFYAGARRYLITSFIDAPIRYHPAAIVPPVLRPMVYRQTTYTGDYLVAYAGACGSIDQMREALESFTDMPTRAYGFGITGEVATVTYRPTSERAFLEDLSGCSAVIATAGHSLVSECLHLAKPMLLMPIARQYEQVLNALHVDRMGVGRHIRSISPATIAEFTKRLDRYRRVMANRPRASLERVLDAVEAELP